MATERNDEEQPMTDETQGARVVDNPDKHRFEAQVAGAVAGFSNYERRGPKIDLTHIEVEGDFEGQGIGSILARRSLDAARDDGLSVLPHCPFVKRYIERHPEYLGLVEVEDRERFGLPTA